jgi:hypothetical protein
MNGYTGAHNYEPAGIMHYGESYNPCSCGGVLHVQNSATGETYSHSKPFASWKEHVALIPGKGAVRIE